MSFDTAGSVLVSMIWTGPKSVMWTLQQKEHKKAAAVLTRMLCTLKVMEQAEPQRNFSDAQGSNPDILV